MYNTMTYNQVPFGGVLAALLGTIIVKSTVIYLDNDVDDNVIYLSQGGGN